MRSLFLTYNGMTSHIGQAQVLPYLTGLAARGHEITIVSFERDIDAAAVADVGPKILKNNIDWRPQTYSALPGPLGKVADQRRITMAAKEVAAEIKPDIVHCRSYVPGKAALEVKRKVGSRFLFDMRGFWVDQRAEGGRWPQDRAAYRWLYRRWKEREAEFIEGADSVVTLTNAAKHEVERWNCYRGSPIHVIPCAVDYDSFSVMDDTTKREEHRKRLGVHSEPLFVYLGSLGSVYLLDDVLKCFGAARRILGGGRLLFLGPHSVAELFARARDIGLDVQRHDILCRQATRAEVPAYLGIADVGLSFIIPSYSSLGVSPTKLGEYLACGLPVICNKGVGDVEDIVAANSAGIVVGSDVAREIFQRRDEIVRLVSLPRAPIRKSSRRTLDLDLAIDAYDKIYRALA